jgi:hypothetical protein
VQSFRHGTGTKSPARLRGEADGSIFDLNDGKFGFEDSDGVKRTEQKMQANKAVVRPEQLFINGV